MRLDRLSLLQLPTPLHRLERASADLGIDLWIKRDDLTGFALGGNKGRKLEFLMADAISKKATVVVTCGSTQSNFVRQLGAACAVLGIRCVAAVMDTPYEHGIPSGPRLVGENGNVVLDEILGVELHRFPDGTWDSLFALTEELERECEGKCETVYRIPVGGSSGVGAAGFFYAAMELQAQGVDFDQIVVASSSGSTQSGLLLGMMRANTRVIGIACDDEPEIAADYAVVARELAALVGLDRKLDVDDFDVRFDWVGGGYGIVSQASTDAIRYLARTEGVFLDPIYTGKAFAAVIDLARAGLLPGRTLFWHTGGSPALFAPIVG